MSNVDAFHPHRRRIDRLRLRGSLFVATVVALVAVAVSQAQPAGAAGYSAKPTVPKGFTITKVADAPKGAGNCDDLGFLDGQLFMGCQDKTTSSGAGGSSTLVEFSLSGQVINTWPIMHKIDGLAGDPLKHYVILTLDEDANSHLATVTPAAPSTEQVTYYNYSPDPRAAGAPIALHTGGGTDQVTVDAAGHILVTGSHAGTSTGTAVFKVALTPPSNPNGTGTATLSPTFADDATATKANMGTGTTQLHLGDVDSGAIVPASSSRFGGSYVITDQTALELVFANNIFNGSGLNVLKTPFGLDDLLWTTAPAGALYVIDYGVPAVLPKTSASAMWKVTGPFKTNTVLASNDGVGDQVVSVNLKTGAVTPFIRHLNSTKGLVYLNPDGSRAQLTLNGGSAVPVSATTTTAGTTKPAATSTTTAAKKSSGSSNTALVIVIVVVVLLLLAGGGYAMSRRGKGGT
jgi:hypothetical protein